MNNLMDNSISFHIIHLQGTKKSSTSIAEIDDYWGKN